MKAVVALFVGLMSFSVFGCASVPMAPKEQSAAMKRWAAQPDTAVVYLYRNENFGAAIPMNVSLDGRAWGQTVAKSYMVWELRPGNHTLVSAAENDSELVISAQPGVRYFVWQEVKMGFIKARSRLQPVSAAEGQAGVDECELIKMPLPQPRPPAPAAPLPRPPQPAAGGSGPPRQPAPTPPTS